MALAKDLSHLPSPAKTRDGGCKPDPEPTFLAPYLSRLVTLDRAEGERPHAIEGTRFRHSMSGGCARAIAYHDLGVPESNPMDLAGIVVTRNGTTKHDEIQNVLLDGYGEALSVEVPAQVEGLDGSGSADGLLEPPTERRVCWEHKNVGGFAFKMAVGERGAAQGPKHAHKVQGALNALALDAELLVVTYMTWEAISVQAAARKGISETGRIAAQWTFERSEWEPLALAERDRVSGILALIDEGTLPARKYPDPELPAGAVITDPATGQWRVTDNEGQILDAGSWWACGYCRWQDTCARTPAGRAPVSTLVEIGALRRLEVVR